MINASQLLENKDFIDLSTKSISLVSFPNFPYDDYVRSYLISLSRCKFSHHLFYTNNINHPSLRILYEIGVDIKEVKDFDYSSKCLSTLIYKTIPKDTKCNFFILLGDYDCFIADVESWEDKFLSYDYIFSPLIKRNTEREYAYIKITHPPIFIKNTPSFRSRRFIETIEKSNKYKAIEDSIDNRMFFIDQEMKDFLSSNNIVTPNASQMEKLFSTYPSDNFHFESDLEIKSFIFCRNKKPNKYIDNFLAKSYARDLIEKISEKHNLNLSSSEIERALKNQKIEYLTFFRKPESKFITQEPPALRRIRLDKVNDNYFIQHFSFDPFIDISDKSITFISLTDVSPDDYYKALCFCLSKVKPTKAKIITSLNISKELTDKFGSLIEIEKPLYRIDCIGKYSCYTLLELYKHIDTQYALIIQSDGYILYQDMWTDDFLKYDYIGAPWAKIVFERFRSYPLLEILSDDDTLLVGNGGFSLRSRKLMKAFSNVNNVKAFIASNSNGEGIPEDLLLCRSKISREILNRKKLKTAPPDVAGIFSNEYDSTYLREKTFGIHFRGNKMLNMVDMELLYDIIRKRY